MFNSIAETEAQIEETKSTILNLQGAICCPECGEKYQKGYKFCPFCGGELRNEPEQEEDIFVDEEVVEAVVDEEDSDVTDMDAGSAGEESTEAVVAEDAEATADETDLDALDGTVVKEVDDSEAVKPAIEEAIEQEIKSKEALSE